MFLFLIPATFGISVDMATPLVETTIAQAQPVPINQFAEPVSLQVLQEFTRPPQPLLLAIEPGGSGGGAQLQAFADTGSYWLDSVELPPVFVAESGSYWLDSFEAAFTESGSYWLDSVAILPVFVAESGSYWLDSAVVSPLFVAESGSYWLDSFEAAIAESGSYSLDSAVTEIVRYSSTQVTPQGAAGMTNIFAGNADDTNVALGDLGFDFRYYEVFFRANVFVGSNSYLTFGFGASTFSGLSRTIPGRALHFGSADRGLQNVFVRADANSFRVRYEGSSSRFFEITLFSDGAMMVVKNTPDNSGLWTVTKGDDISFTDYAPSAETSFVIMPNAAFTAYTVQPGSYV